MPTRFLSLTSIFLLAGTGGLTSAVPVPACMAGQDSGESLLEATASFRSYLERNPFHGGVFGELCERASDLGGLEPLVAHYRGLVGPSTDAAGAADTGSQSARVLLTRLLMMRTDYEQALEASVGLEALGVEGMLLVGDLKLRAGEAEAGAALLESALDAAESMDERARVLRRLCEVFAGAGDAAGLARSAAALGELDPQDPALQREAAEQLVDGELLPEAVEAYRRALELVPDDVPRRTQTLADMGACHERLFEGDRALDCYGQALELLHSEHWLAIDLAKRRLGLHRTAGTLDLLAEELRTAAQGQRGGAGPWIQLAELETARYRSDQAVDALLAGREIDPDNGRLSDLLVQAAEAAGRLDVQRAELERRIADRPGDLGLRLRLVRSLARSDEPGQAKALLETLTRGAEARPEWASALAQGWLGLGDGPRALAVLDAAIEQGPRVGLVLERAKVAADQGDRTGALEGLASAQVEDSDDLLALAELQRELGDGEGARLTLEKAVQASPDAPDALQQLADLLIDLGDVGEARRALRRAMPLAPQREQHSLVRQLARLLRASHEREAWIEQERGNFKAEIDGDLPLLVLATLQARTAPESAIEYYAAYAARVPDDEEALRSWARLLAQEGRLGGALGVLDQLAACGPAARQAALFEKVGLLQGERRSREIPATLRTLVRLVWTQPDALRRCAKAYVDAGEPEAAIEVWDRVLQLEPEDSATARRSAALLLELDRDGQARTQLIRAWRFADPEYRPKIAEELIAAWGEGAEDHVAEMADRALANPYDRGLALLAAQLALRSTLPELAKNLADLHLGRRPRDGEFLGVRARVQLIGGDTVAATQTVRLLVDYGAPRDDLVLDLVPSAMKAGGMDAVAALGPFAEKPIEVAQRLDDAGFPLRAVGLLRGSVESGAPLEEGSARLLVKLYAYVEPAALAIRAFELIEELDGPCVVTTHRLGLLHARSGAGKQALACALRLESLGAADPMVESFVRAAKLQDAWEAR